jgi:hypothetical protein
MPSKIEYELTKLRGKVSENEELYTDTIAALEDKITTLETKVTSLDADITTNKQKADGAMRKATKASSDDSGSLKKSGVDTLKAISSLGISVQDNIGRSNCRIGVNGHSIETDKLYELTTNTGITIDGTLIKDGLVDGRDPSVDGTKLDTVATNATKYPDTGEQAFLDADHTKLNAIAANATKYPDTGEQAFLDADHTKLNAIAANATKYPDTGEQAFLDADHTKLNGIDSGADVTGSNTPQAHSVSAHTDRTRTVFTKSHFYTDGTINESGVFLPDAATKQVNYRFKVPEDFVSVTELRVIYRLNFAGTNHIATMYFEARYGALSQTHNVHQENSGAVSLSLNGKTNGVLYSETNANVDLADLAKNDYVSVEVKRAGAHGSDTWINSIIILGIEMEYISDE